MPTAPPAAARPRRCDSAFPRGSRRFDRSAARPCAVPAGAVSFDPAQRARHPHARRAWRAGQRALAALDRRARGHRPARCARGPAALLVSAGVTVAVAFLVGVAAAAPSRRISRCATRSQALPPAERVAARRLVGAGRRRRATPRSTGRRAGAPPARSPGEPSTRSLELDDVRLRHAASSSSAPPTRSAASSHLRRAGCPARARRAAARSSRSAGRRCGRIDDVRRPPRRRRPRHARLARPVRRGRARDRSRPPAERGPSPCCSRRASRGLAALRPAARSSRATTAGARRSTPSAAHVWDVDRLLAAEGRAQSRLTAANGQFGLTRPRRRARRERARAGARPPRGASCSSAAPPRVLLLAFAGHHRRRAPPRRAGRAAPARPARGDALAAVRRSCSPRRSRPCCPARRRPALGVGRGRADRPPRGTCRRRRALRTASLTPTSVALVAAGALGALAAVVVSRCAQPTAGRPRASARSTWRRVGAVVALGLLLARGAGRRRRARRRPGASRWPRRRCSRASPSPSCSAACSSRRSAPACAPRATAPSTLLLALLTLHRSPGRTAGVVGFLAVSAGLADVRALLPRDARHLERRARRLRGAARLHARRRRRRSSRRATSPSPAGYRALAPGVGAWPILRQVGRGRRRRAATPAHADRARRARRRVRRCCTAGAATSPSRLAARARPAARSRAGPVALAGAAIPRTATRLELPVRARRARPCSRCSSSRRATGDADQLLAAGARSGRRRARRGRAAGRPRRPDRRAPLELPVGGAAVGRPPGGRGAQRRERLRAARSRSAPSRALTPGGRVRLPSFAGWAGHGGLDRARQRRRAARLRYSIDTAEQALLRPRQPFDGRRLPVVASPDVAAGAGPAARSSSTSAARSSTRALVAGRARFPTTQDAARELRRRRRGLAGLGDRRRRPADLDPGRALAVGAAGGAGARRRRARAAAVRLARDQLAVGDPRPACATIRSRAASSSRSLAAAIAAVALALVGLALVTRRLPPRRRRHALRPRVAGRRARARCAPACAGARSGSPLLGLAAGVVLGIGLMVALTGRLLALDATLARSRPAAAARDPPG